MYFSATTNKIETLFWTLILVGINIEVGRVLTWVRAFHLDLLVKTILFFNARIATLLDYKTLNIVGNWILDYSVIWIVNSNKSDQWILWGSEYRNSLIFEWSKQGQTPNRPVFECHLNTGHPNCLNTEQMDAILFSYSMVQYLKSKFKKAHRC